MKLYTTQLELDGAEEARVYYYRTGEAASREIIASLGEECTRATDIISALRKVFGTKDTTASVQHELFSRKQG